MSKRPAFRRQFELHLKSGISFTVDVSARATATGSSSHDTGPGGNSGAKIDAPVSKDWRRKLLFVHKDHVVAIVEIREPVEPELQQVVNMSLSPRYDNWKSVQ